MSAPEIVVIDYGSGNLLSVQRGLEHCGATVILSCEPDRILSAQRVILPGVGAFGNAMQALTELNLIPVIQEVATRGSSLLGICLGMQLLLDESEEFGMTQGLGLIPGQVRAIPSQSTAGEDLKTPHVGWNGLLPADQSNWQGTLLTDNQFEDAMYFVHSFMAIPADNSNLLADCIYGGYRIPAVIKKNNIMGCQFHPEKSGELGLKVLQRFVHS
jgi:imidazole glycerol-phosphate synthase subunit HisH